MQVRSGGVAGAAHIIDGLSLFDRITSLYNDSVHMSATDGISATVTGVRTRTVTTALATLNRRDDPTVIHRNDRFAVNAGTDDVDTFVSTIITPIGNDLSIIWEQPDKPPFADVAAAGPIVLATIPSAGAIILVPLVDLGIHLSVLNS